MVENYIGNLKYTAPQFGAANRVGGSGIGDLKWKTHLVASICFHLIQVTRGIRRGLRSSCPLPPWLSINKLCCKQNIKLTSVESCVHISAASMLLRVPHPLRSYLQIVTNWGVVDTLYTSATTIFL